MKILIRFGAAVCAAALLLVAGGCDMFRTLAGRPTSEDLDAMRRELREAEDSLAVVDSIIMSGGKLRSLSSIGGDASGMLLSEYYVIVGSFVSMKNADAFLSDVSGYGYDARIINFSNGFNSIAVSPSSSLKEAFAALKRLRQEPFCPADAWILVNE